jgi:hypothetical protein
MEAVFIFIAKSSGLLVMFYFAYFLLLRKETFFNSNRWFLLAGLITAVVLPFLVYTKVIWVDPTPLPVLNYSPAYLPQAIEKESFEINWNYVALGIYSIGFIALIIKFVLDFYSLNSVLKGKSIKQQADFKFIDIQENIAPFSYFDYIVYNSSMYTASELESIIEHEKVHSDQNHTMDVLISRLFCVLFWFNPIIWLYKKAILQNLEFIADSEASKKIADKKAYQYTLLKITAHESCVSITNHFYQSLIKKRIVMLNKNQSKKRNYWKYYAIVPALVAFVLVFQIETIAQEKKESQQVAVKENPGDVFKIQKNTTDQELKEMSEKLKQKHDVDVVISNVKRNSKNELTAIKVDLKKGNQQAQTVQIQSSAPIKGYGIVITTEADGTKLIGIETDGDAPIAVKNRIVEIHHMNNRSEGGSSLAPPAPPIPPVPPVFPNGPLPTAPAPDMSKMPKAPAPPANSNDKTAMKKFEKEMADFDKKMENYEPDMSAYEKEVGEIMEKRSAIFDKEMEKFDLAMEKYNQEMEQFSQSMGEHYRASDRDYNLNMKQYEKNMKIYEKNMRLHEREMKKHERENKRS